jgi:hypothetical protein
MCDLWKKWYRLKRGGVKRSKHARPRRWSFRQDPPNRRFQPIGVASASRRQTRRRTLALARDTRTMRFHANHVSSSISGDYYQAMFEAEKDCFSAAQLRLDARLIELWRKR